MFRALGVLVALLGPGLAHADFGTGIDVMENIFGATNINATLGHGRLTAGVSRDGDLTLLSWPGPSYADQLAYLSSNDIDARARPRFGAEPGMGSFLGLVVETAGGSQVTWFRDASEWSVAQSYGPTFGPNPRTVFESTTLGLAVVITDAIDPDRDVLVRQVEVTRSADSPVIAAWLLSYANLSPMPVESKIPKLPLADWVLDGRNDFAAIWDPSAEAVIHFHPGDQLIVEEAVDLIAKPTVDFGPIGTVLESASPTAGQLDSLVAAVDSFQPGAYLGFTTSPAPDQFQVGFDQTPLCGALDSLASNIEALPGRFPDLPLPLPEDALGILRCPDNASRDWAIEEGWSYTAEDALSDAADGELSGSRVAAGEVNEALRTPLTFTDDQAVAFMVLAAGATAAEVRQKLSEVDATTVAARAEAAVDGWLVDKRLPTGLGEQVARVARRTLLNVRVGTDAATGAVVASIARQPPYHLDWPRDGAFFNVMLDVSGQVDLVSRRSQLYRSWQRTAPAVRDPLTDPEPPRDPDGGPPNQYPAHAWDMNYLADGTVGGIFRFEIDTTAFAVWTMVAHVGWLPDGQREAYLRSHWDSIRAATDLLARWKDADTGLQAPAQEDDSGEIVQTIHGAATVFGAIEIAARAARFLGEDADARRWEKRGDELRRAIIRELYDRDEERFVMGKTGRGPFAASGLTPSGPTGWLVWPMTILPLDDERIKKQVDYDLGIVTPMIDLEEIGGLYFMKNTNAAAVALLGLEGDERLARQAELERLTRALAAHATPDTNQFGEVMVVITDENGERHPEQRTSTPHLWESTLFYLTAIAVEDPEAVLAYDRVLPPSRIGQGDDGCGCQSQTPGGQLPVLVILLIIALRPRTSA